jgi:hypothetical protein
VIKENGRRDGARGGASEEGSLVRMGHNNPTLKNTGQDPSTSLVTEISQASDLIV